MKKLVIRLVSLVMLMMCGLTATAQNQMKTHVVQSGETLYSISRQNGLTVDDVLKANPGLTENLLAGQSILIPMRSTHPEIQNLGPCKSTHIVKKKETLYAISNQYGVSIEELLDANPQIGDKLKKGTELCIPYSRDEIRANIERQAQVFEKIENNRQESLIQHYDVIKIAVIAPFALNETRRSTEAQKITDFYKGFLLAVDAMKQKGISTEISAYEEIGNDGQSISTVLTEPKLKEANLIIGPFRPANAIKVAAFAADNNIKMVTPMSMRNYDLSAYKNLFQISTPQNIVYEQVFEKFLHHYSTYNVVFLGMSEMKENVDFVIGMKGALRNKGVEFKTLGFENIAQLPDVLSKEKTNIIIPSSASDKALTSIFNHMAKVDKELAEYKIRFFGYPEWQTFTDHIDNLSRYNSVFYTTFFANPQSESVTQFNNTFTKWFHREQVRSYPSYGILGYDIGMYFINGLNRKGTSFSAKTQVPYQGLQTNFRFEGNADGRTAINRGIMFVRFNSDGNYIITR